MKKTVLLQNILFKLSVKLVQLVVYIIKSLMILTMKYPSGFWQQVEITIKQRKKFLMKVTETIQLMLCENCGKIQPIHKTFNLTMELIRLT